MGCELCLPRKSLPHQCTALEQIRTQAGAERQGSCSALLHMGLGWQLAHSCSPYVFPKCWCSSVQATPSLACGCSFPSCLCSKHVSYRLSRSSSQDLTQVQPYLTEAAGRLFTLFMESFFAGRISKKMASTLWQSSCLRLQNAGITGMSQYSQVL